MKKIKIRLMCSLMCIVGCFSTLHAQLVFKTTSPSVIAYYEYVPEDYHTNSNKYPVVFFLHGIGERGPNTTDLKILEDNIYKVAKIGPAKFVKSGTQYPFILIAPQLKNNNGLWSSKYVMEVINYAKQYLRIDERRIYLTGLSLGGGGTWVTAQDYAQEFAAIAPVCGGYNSTSKAINLAKENLPVWAFHGDKDSIVPLSRSANMVNAINNCTPKPNPLAKLTIYPGVAHNAWDYAYKPDHTVHNPNVYDWLLKYTNTTNAGNKIPVANAGADQTKTSSSTTITGSGSDVDGTIVSYAWAKINGPSATLTNTSSKSLSVSKMVTGTYLFRLTVKDNHGNTDSDYVKVTVNGTSSETTNANPVANAGSDKSITLPTNYTSLTGSGTDSDGSIAAYSWTKLSGGTASLSGTSTARLNVSNMVQGTYIFRLTVKDNNGSTDSDDVTVVVKSSTTTTPTTANAAPVANAGANLTVTLPKNYATITGSGKDADGSIVSYTWTKIRGGSAVLSGTSTSNLSISGLSEGWYVFRLTVKDDKGATDSDDIGVDVKAATSSTTAPTPEPEPEPEPEPTPTPAPTTANTAPVANAGTNVSVTLPRNYATISGSGKDADGSIVSYTWTKIRGGSAVLNGANTSNLSVTGLSEGWYVFRLTVKDDKGATDYDDMGLMVYPSSM